MAAPFKHILFPMDISFGSRGGPSFLTDIAEGQGGYEYRNGLWSLERRKYNVLYGIRERAHLDNLLAFFRVVRGSLYGFLYLDYQDYSFTGVVLGVGDGSQTEFQLIKIYSAESETYSYIVKKPVAGSCTMYLDDVEQTTGWSVSSITGIVTFDVAPGEGVVVKADCSGYCVPCRFEADELMVTLEAVTNGSAEDIMLIEDRQ
jgi:uncharacterized protein (TIGR02217 family)